MKETLYLASFADCATKNESELKYLERKQLHFHGRRGWKEHVLFVVARERFKNACKLFYNPAGRQFFIQEKICFNFMQTTKQKILVCSSFISFRIYKQMKMKKKGFSLKMNVKTKHEEISKQKTFL